MNPMSSRRPRDRRQRVRENWARLRERLRRDPEEDPPAPPPVDPVAERRSRQRRSGALAGGILAAALVVLLVVAPEFRAQQVVVQGNQRQTTDQILAAARLGHPGSVFLVDGAAVRQRLGRLTWIRSSEVRAELPDRVVITVQEWEPVATYQAIGGISVYLDRRGRSLGPAPGGEPYLPIQGPAANTAPHRRLIDAALLTSLINIQSGLPALIGQNVTGFQFDRCWDLTMTAGVGWRAYFGRMATPEDYGSLESKLVALQAVEPYIDFSDPHSYVNLENPSEPAVGKGPDTAPTPAPTPKPTPTPSPHATPTASPRPGATPTATPAPTPTAAPKASPSPAVRVTPTTGPTVVPNTCQ